MLKNWCFCVVGEDSSRVPWTARSNQSILREINLECSLKGLMLKLKLQYFGHWMQRTDLLEKTLRKDWRWEEKGTTEDEMVEWHHWLHELEVEQAREVGDRQGSLVCCSPWGHKESEMTEWPNWTEYIFCKWLNSDHPITKQVALTSCTCLLIVFQYRSQCQHQKSGWWR